GSDHHKHVNQIYVIGPPQDTEIIAPALAQELKVPCDVVHPAAALRLKKIPREQTPNAGAALGLAAGKLDARGLPFDFLNPKRPAAPGLNKRTKILLYAATVSILALLLAGLRTHWIRQRLRTKATVQEQVNSAAKQVNLYRQIQYQARTLRNWMDQDRRWLDHIAYLSAVLPACRDLYLTSLSTSSRGALYLTVKARNGETISTLDRRLRAAGYEVKPASVIPTGDRYGYEFQAGFELEIPPDLQINLTQLEYSPRPEDDGSLDSTPPAGSSRGRNRRNRAESVEKGGETGE
ncbi:MAG: hypothetical protein JXM70_11260, partial [Pirellulales bacterium]|nr:hypothetical protein [Pirellulales bacterium]